MQCCKGKHLLHFYRLKTSSVSNSSHNWAKRLTGGFKCTVMIVDKDRPTFIYRSLPTDSASGIHSSQIASPSGFQSDRFSLRRTGEILKHYPRKQHLQTLQVIQHKPGWNHLQPFTARRVRWGLEIRWVPEAANSSRSWWSSREWKWWGRTQRGGPSAPVAAHVWLCWHRNLLEWIDSCKDHEARGGNLMPRLA